MMNPAPQGGAPQRPQGQAPSPQAQPQGPGQSPAEQVFAQAYQSLLQVKKLIQSAGPAVPPQDHQLLDTCLKTFEQLVASLKGPAPGQAPPQQAPGAAPPQPQAGPPAPMAQHAAKGARPAGY